MAYHQAGMDDIGDRLSGIGRCVWSVFETAIDQPTIHERVDCGDVLGGAGYIAGTTFILKSPRRNTNKVASCSHSSIAGRQGSLPHVVIQGPSLMETTRGLQDHSTRGRGRKNCMVCTASAKK